MRTLLLTAMIFALNVPHARALDPRERQKAANIDWHTRGVKVAEFTRHLISGKVSFFILNTLLMRAAHKQRLRRGY
jgi:hypothetical protein